MSRSHLIEVAPAMWAIEPGRVLRLGRARVPFDEIVACEAEEVVERDIAGLAIVALLFLGGATVFLTGVGQFGWRPRFLIAVVFLTLLGFSALGEMFSSKAIRLGRVRLTTADGDAVTFSTPNVTDAARIKALVEAHCRA